jgi:hypothetical protein
MALFSKKMVFGIIGIVSIAFISGCHNEDISLTPKLTVYGKGALRSGEIKLPANYNKDNYRKLLLAVSFQDIAVKAGDISPDICQTLSSRLQTEMAKLKRFTVFSIHNRGGVRLLKNLSDIGEAKMTEPTQMKDVDLVLTASISVSKEKHDRYDDELIIYEVECDFSCEDLKTKTIKFAEKAMGRTTRVVIADVTGRRMGGYDERNEKQAIYNAAMKALMVVANKLGNTYPVGGNITGMLGGKRMTLDKGFEHGIAKNMQMIVYTTISGVDLPLGVAEASPGSTTSNLVMWRWNNDDEYAAPIIKAMKSDPSWLDKNKLYTASYGMATPPDWERAYKDKFDESMRK